MSKKNAMECTPVTGEVFTKPEVVRHMLNEIESAGRFRQWRNLRVLEPSCGEGAFVVPLIEKLCAEVEDWNDDCLRDYLRTCDISASNIECVKRKVAALLRTASCPESTIEELLSAWLICGDFLLVDFGRKFDVVVGNPPYIRFDDIESGKQRQYRDLYSTFSERCDIYVPFFEKSLSLLSERGVFSFICTNRFVRSSYGKRLRRFIADKFHVALYLNMEHAQPFVEQVSAYPAIYVIDRKVGGCTYSGTIDDASEETLKTVRTRARSTRLGKFDKWYHGDSVWTTTDCREKLESEQIERRYPTIEESGKGTKLGIGVASGADDIYLNPQLNAPIEKDCLIPLVASEDIRRGSIVWDNRFMLNPYDPFDDTKMLDFSQYPETASYFKTHSKKLKSRYCAKKHPDSWYRTLDRIHYDVWGKPKILLPDIQVGGNVALDETGQFYPHHNVYWITSDVWNMRALCVLLRSTFVTEQIRRYSVQMRGGSIRYQAQNLRNVHIPAWDSLSADDVSQLVSAYDEQDVSVVDRIVAQVLKGASTRQKPRMTQGELF
ncbi:MAG: Eco57I restriction-modification methylase domain-containing protein [Kiritimatiellia bacterium]